jgi:LuxR family maltose regulon positive regulatory protein
MAVPLLATKLHVPRRRPGVVARPRLGERLGRSRDAGLTLLSAPAGFGKTTLLTDWLATVPGGRPVAWLSLDARDNDPVLFWTYLVTALDTAVPGVGAPRALTLLQSPQPTVEAVLATVLNDLGTVADDVVLVLDDFHVIEAAEIEEGMTFLLEHLPPQLHLVIATRADPALPLARWRVRGELVELRAADLRFTPDETADYLGGLLGPVLTAADVAALEERTEGWIAALQLAVLSLQGRTGPAWCPASCR